MKKPTQSSHILLACSILALTLLACNNQEIGIIDNVNSTFRLDSIPIKKELKSELLDLGIVYSPNELFVGDSTLFIASSGTDFNVTLFDISSSHRRKGQIIPYGQGPDEALSVYRMFFDDDENFWIHDVISPNLKKFKISNESDTLYAKPLDQIVFNKLSILEGWFMENTIITTTTDINPLTRFYIYDLNGNYIRANGSYPSYDREIPGTAKVEVFTSHASAHPNKKKFVLVYEYTDLIEFYDENAQLIKQIQGPDLFLPNFELGVRGGYPTMKRLLDKTQEAYMKVVSNGERIFILYAGGSTRQKGKSEEGIHHKNIISLDWEGNVLAKYTLDHAVTTIAVDWNRGSIYGLDKIESQVYLFKF
jgi:hypothetical protein